MDYHVWKSNLVIDWVPYLINWWFSINLTNNVKPERQTHLGLRIDLALVDARVSLLGELDEQRPVLWLLRPDDLEPLVTSVGQHTRGQNVQVTLPYPRYLHSIKLIVSQASKVSVSNYSGNENCIYKNCHCWSIIFSRE